VVRWNREPNLPPVHAIEQSISKWRVDIIGTHLLWELGRERDGRLEDTGAVFSKMT
jgi:hypothetical protein